MNCKYINEQISQVLTLKFLLPSFDSFEINLEPLTSYRFFLPINANKRQAQTNNFKNQKNTYYVNTTYKNQLKL